MQAPQPPVQLLSCKEGKYLANETPMKRTGYDTVETRGQMEFEAFRTHHGGKEKSRLH